jgi:hypothetical protein
LTLAYEKAELREPEDVSTNKEHSGYDGRSGNAIPGTELLGGTKFRLEVESYGLRQASLSRYKVAP